MDNRHNQNVHAPLYEALIQHRKSGKRSYHVPGHKNGQVYSKYDPSIVLQDAMSIDATEITGLDDLHHPESIIQEAQNLSADYFGAEESFFLVGGSTSGNIALLLTVCTEPGDIILVQRNVHKSIIHGLMLARAHAVFLSPQVDPVSGLATAPSATTIKEALHAYPHAKGVFITMPNYYGMGFELKEISGICHYAGVPLLVDEAHGAHYGHHPAFPDSAIHAGADGVVQSTHKMLSAMTMGAMLHVQGDLLDRELLQQRLSMIQSSSPSYPIMASLDLARFHLEYHGSDAFTTGLSAANLAREKISEHIPRFGVLHPSCKDKGYTAQDPFKLVIYDKEKLLTGYQLQHKLEEHDCIPEMSDETFVVILFSLGSTEEDAMHLLDALMHITLEEKPKQPLSLSGQKQISSRVSTWNILQSAVFSCPVPFHLGKIDKGKKEQIKITEASGRISAEMVIPYPPGIPILYPGERINSDMKDYLIQLRDSRAKIQANADPSLETIWVMVSE